MHQDRWKCNEALRESEERLRALSDNLPMGMVYQLDAGQDGSERRFSYVSAGVVQMHGITPEQALKDASLVYAQVLEEDRHFIAEGEALSCAGMTPFNAEVRLRLPSGQVVWRLFRSAPRRLPNHHLVWDGVEIDVTDRRRAEEEKERLQSRLIEAQKMESVGRLAGGVAHEFNNMLGVIIGNAEIASLQVCESDPIHHHLQEIIDAGTRSVDTVRQLLGYARRQAIHPEVIDLNEIIAAQFNTLQRLVGEDIHLAWRPGENLGRMKMDRAQVSYILTNLVVNGRDAIHGGGRITMESSNVLLDEDYCRAHYGSVPGEYILLTVSDTGTGISRENMKRIFDPFFTTKEVGGGKGLGLATMYGIVKQNNGHINVYSELNHGTVFRVYFRRCDGTDASDQEEARGTLPGGTETILVVEDELRIRNIARDILTQRGYTVLTAGTPVEALSLAEDYTGEIDLLLTDLVMPGMNGEELMEKLRAQRSKIRALFMSGYTAEVVVRHRYLDDGVSFVEKPFTQKMLTEKVRAVLDSPSHNLNWLDSSG